MGEYPSDGIFRVAGPKSGGGVPVDPGSSPLVMFEAPNNGSWINPFARTLTGLNGASNVVYAPAVGSRVVLSGLMISMSSNISRGVASTVAVTLSDGVTTVFGWQIFIPAAAGTAVGGPSTGWVSYPLGGFRCATSASLTLAIPGGLTTGTCSITLTGWEI